MKSKKERQFLWLPSDNSEAQSVVSQYAPYDIEFDELRLAVLSYLRETNFPPAKGESLETTRNRIVNPVLRSFRQERLIPKESVKKILMSPNMEAIQFHHMGRLYYPVMYAVIRSLCEITED